MNFVFRAGLTLRAGAVADDWPGAGLHYRCSLQVFARQQSVANASGAMRIRNIGMLLNPSPCQFADTAQDEDVILRAHELFAALARFPGGSEPKKGLVDENVRRPNEGNPSRRRRSP